MAGGDRQQLEIKVTLQNVTTTELPWLRHFCLSQSCLRF